MEVAVLFRTLASWLNPKDQQEEILAKEMDALDIQIREKGEQMHRQIGVHKFGYISSFLRPNISKNFEVMISSYGDVLSGKMCFGFKTGSGDLNVMGLAQIIAKNNPDDKYKAKVGDFVVFQLRLDAAGKIKGNKSAKWVPYNVFISEVGPVYPQRDAEAFWGDQSRARDEKSRRAMVQRSLSRNSLG